MKYSIIEINGDSEIIKKNMGHLIHNVQNDNEDIKEVFSKWVSRNIGDIGKNNITIVNDLPADIKKDIYYLISQDGINYILYKTKETISKGYLWDASVVEKDMIGKWELIEKIDDVNYKLNLTYPNNDYDHLFLNIETENSVIITSFYQDDLNGFEENLDSLIKDINSGKCTDFENVDNELIFKDGYLCHLSSSHYAITLTKLGTIEQGAKLLNELKKIIVCCRKNEKFIPEHKFFEKMVDNEKVISFVI